MIYRVYFNRCEDWPQIWSVDCGDQATEVNVIGFRVEGACDVASGRAEDFQAVDSTRAPKAWMCVEAAQLRIEDGVAVFVDALGLR